MHRAVAVSWLARPGILPAQELSREIGWSNLPASVLEDSVTWTDTKSERTITEDAAIGVTALLLHDLEKFRIRRVVKIGNGGDYHLELEDGTETQLECSGVYIDPHGYKSNDRLQVKLAQVLTTSEDGFAAIATFSRTATQEPHCYLHFVTKATLKPRRKQRKPKRQKKKPGGNKP